MDNKHYVTLAKGASLFFIGMIVAKFFSYFYRLILARGLGPESYGTFSLAFVIFSVGALLSLFGLNIALERYIGIYSAKQQEGKLKGAIISALQIALPLSIIMVIAVVFFSSQIAGLFKSQALLPLIPIFALMIPFFVLTNIFAAVSRGFKNVKYPVLIQNVLSQFLIFILAFAALLRGYGLFEISITYLFALIITAVAMFIAVEKKIFSIIGTRIKAVFMKKELFVYSWPLVISSLFGLIIGWTDTLMLGYFKTEEIVGIYNSALPTAYLLLLVPMALTSLLLPVISDFFAKNQEKMISQTISTVTKWIFYVNFPLFLLLLIFPRKVLNLLFGEQYLLAAIPLMILGFGYFMNSIAYASFRLIELFKKTKYHFYNNLVAAIVNVLLNILLIPRYGMIGAAIASATALTLVFCLALTQVYIIKRINVFSMDILKSGLIAFGLAVLIYFVSKQAFGTVGLKLVIVLCAVYFGLYALAIYLVGLVGAQEKEAINSLLFRIGLKFKI